MKIVVVILHYGNIAVTKRCVASLLAHEKQKFSLIVVNNMPQKLTPGVFTKRKVKVINNKKNLGFAAGVNVGIKKTMSEKADYICLLNNDTVIQKPILKVLTEECAKDQIGITGPAILFLKNGKKMFDIGGKVNHLYFRTSHNEVSKITNKKPKIVDYVSGCCMVIRKAVFKKNGLFDESFFLYYEDADFCMRAKKAGFLASIVPNVTIEHELSKSAGVMSKLAIYHLLRSAITFGKKYAKSPLQKIANKLFILSQAALFFKANPKSVSVITQALLHN